MLTQSGHMSSAESPPRSSAHPAVWYVPALMLFFAVAPLPYAYYTLLRWVVCGAVLFLAYDEHDGLPWLPVFILLAVIFNPLFPIPMTREMWAPVDFCTAIFLLVHRFSTFGRTAPKNSNANESAPAPPRAPGGSRVSRAANSNALAAKSRLQGYEIVRVLGEGGFGITYLAFDHQLDGAVALKEYFYALHATRAASGAVVLGSSSSAGAFQWGRDRFLNEARVLAQLDHPNIVRVHRYFEENNTAYIVMEYVEGESLADFLKKHGVLTPEQWWPWMKSLLAGLEHVHGHKYLHRDIKPENIVIRADKRRTMPVLVDFGSARVATGERTHTQVVTPGYAPIEQHSNLGRQGPYTDIYGLAVVSYQVLTGTLLPSAPDRVLEDRYEPLVTKLKRPADGFLAAIDKALALLPADRPQSIAVWRTELNRDSPAKRMSGRRSATRSPLPLRPFGMAEGSKLRGNLSSKQRTDILQRMEQHDRERRLERLRVAANRGSPRAQLELADMYTHGKGVERDPVQAAQLFRKAADRGHREAQTRLGWMYFRGNGMSRDYAAAEKWFRAAADQGHADGEFAIGWMYFRGEGLPRDYAAAEKWFRAAADQGHEQARNALGAFAPTSSPRGATSPPPWD